MKILTALQHLIQRLLCEQQSNIILQRIPPTIDTRGMSRGEFVTT